MAGNQKKHILLVEDEALIAAGEASLLEKNGYDVITAYDGESAVKEALSGKEISLILMDIDLGEGMDGVRAAEIILKERPIPILFLSSHTEPEIVDRTERISSFGYMIKNSSVTVLLASIKMAFRLAEARSEIMKKNEELAVSNEELETLIEEMDRAGEELERSYSEIFRVNELLEAAEEIAMLGCWELNMADGSGTWSPEMFRLTGFDPGKGSPPLEEFLGFLHPEDRVKQRDFLDNILNTGESAAFDLRSNPGMGPVRHFIGRIKPAAGDDGSVVKLAGTLQDITERKKMEASIESAKKAWERTFDALPDFVAIINSDFIITRVNAAMAAFFGKRPEELVGKYCYEVVHEKGGPIENCPCKDAMQDGKFHEKEIFDDKTGSWFMTYAAPFIDREGNVTACAHLMRDITERKIIDNKFLTDIAGKEALLKELQHRVKNSLVMISSIIDLERDRNENSGAKKVLGNLKGRVDSIMNLYSILHQSENITNVDIGKYLKAVISSLSDAYAMEMKGIVIDTDMEPMTAEPTRAAAIGLIVNELITNSLKHGFRGRGKGVIKIKLKKSETGVSLTVYDDGNGPPEDFQPDNSESFGMLIVKMLARQLGGTLTYERSGHTRFQVDFPVK